MRAFALGLPLDRYKVQRSVLPCKAAHLVAFVAAHGGAHHAAPHVGAECGALGGADWGVRLQLPLTCYSTTYYENGMHALPNIITGR